jgi:hypothetical protein
LDGTNRMRGFFDRLCKRLSAGAPATRNDIGYISSVFAASRSPIQVWTRADGET